MQTSINCRTMSIKSAYLIRRFETVKLLPTKQWINIIHKKDVYIYNFETGSFDYYIVLISFTGEVFTLAPMTQVEYIPTLASIIGRN